MSHNICAMSYSSINVRFQKELNSYPSINVSSFSRTGSDNAGFRAEHFDILYVFFRHHMQYL